MWIGDIGDNDSRFKSIRLFRISEPTRLGDQEVPARRYSFRYPDGAHNAEAMLVDPLDGTIYIVTKEALGAGIYASAGLPEAGAESVLQRVASAPMFVTDGAMSPDANQVALRTYTSLHLFDSSMLLNGDEDGERYQLPRQPQGETLAYARGGKSVIVGSEGVGTTLLAVELPTSSPDPPSASAGVTPRVKDSGLSTSAWMAAGLGALVLITFGAAAAIAFGSRPRR
jgi:hypothetical protein